MIYNSLCVSEKATVNLRHISSSDDLGKMSVSFSDEQNALNSDEPDLFPVRRSNSLRQLLRNPFGSDRKRIAFLN